MQSVHFVCHDQDFKDLYGVITEWEPDKDEVEDVFDMYVTLSRKHVCIIMVVENPVFHSSIFIIMVH